MTDLEMKKNITALRAEVDSYLAAGDRAAIIKAIALLEKTWEVIFAKDDGIRQTYFFQKIWLEEQATGEESIFTDVAGISDVEDKLRRIRHALFRLENDFPLDLCLEALHTLSEARLSGTALREILDRYIEDAPKTLARISEIAQ